MVKALACRVEGPRFKSHHGKSFEKVSVKKVSEKKSQPAILCLHDGSPDDRSAPQLVKRLGCVLSCLYDWCTQKNRCGPSEHAQPPYFYLQLTCVSVCEWQHWRQLEKEDLCRLWIVDLYAPQGVDLEEGGSLSYWHDSVKYWPELHWLL